MADSQLNLKRTINYSWLFKMAWRDSRKNRSRLFLFISSIILGIAAIVAVYSFRDNLQRDIDNQAKTLTGADLILDSRRKINPSAVAVLDTIGTDRSKEVSFASMIYFAKGGGSRLIQVRALEGDYPYYGEIESTPVKAATEFRSDKKTLVDKTLMLQFNAAVGDSIRIGSQYFVIAGTLESVPGQSGIASTVAPIAYIPLRYLESTGLDQPGSRMQYRYYYKFNKPAEFEKELKKIQPLIKKEGLDQQTVASKKESTGRAFGDLNKFLALSGFIALLLGCIGVGSAIHVYINEKLGTIATLRCLGLNASEAFLIYLIQVAFIGLIGAIAGAALGTIIQFGLPLVLKDFIPIEITMQISWTAILQGLALGVLIAILFALPSLVAVRNISPLNAIRSSFEKATRKVDPLKWFVYLLIVLFICGFTYLQTLSGTQTVAFILSIVIAYLLLAGLAKLMMTLIRKLTPDSMSYLWRQGFANLYRPNNQTLMLTVSIGLATALIVTLYLVQGVLINKISPASETAKPNMFVFDIQSNQRDAVVKIAEKHKVPVLDQAAIVTMRLEEINGKTAEALALADSLASLKDNKGGEKDNSRTSGRAFKGEIRATYQEKLTDMNSITDGKWIGTVGTDGKVYISLEKGYAESLNVKLGDQLTFNVQGMLIPTFVGSIRSVNWNSVQTNFRVIFPSGVLEKAPQFDVLMTNVPSESVSASFQNEVVQTYPNISIIDLGLILKVLDELLSKISFVIRFMAGFSMATGWIVLISAVLSSKGQRVKEIVLLRTLGANRKQILTITALEYLILGLLATLTGIIFALVATWALASFSLKASFSPDLLPILIFLIVIPLMIVITGVYSSRSVLNQPPLQILRKES